MFDTDDIIFISAEFNAEQYSKIVEVLNAHKIRLTNDENQATITLKPANKEQNQKLITVAVFTIKDSDEKIYVQKEIHQMPPPPIISDMILMNPKPEKHKNKHNPSISNYNMKKYKQIQQTHKQTIFNRTRHK